MQAFAKILLPIAASFVCLTASAGTKIDYFLSIDRNNHSVYGAMGSVRRDTAVANGFIGCSLMAGYIALGDLWIQCQAQDGAGLVTCVTSVTATSPLVKVVQSITSNSYLNFTWDPSQAVGGISPCTSIQVANGSMLYPRVF